MFQILAIDARFALLELISIVLKYKSRIHYLKNYARASLYICELLHLFSLLYTEILSSRYSENFSDNFSAEDSNIFNFLQFCFKFEEIYFRSFGKVDT